MMEGSALEILCCLLREWIKSSLLEGVFGLKQQADSILSPPKETTKLQPFFCYPSFFHSPISRSVMHVCLYPSTTPSKLAAYIPYN